MSLGWRGQQLPLGIDPYIDHVTDSLLSTMAVTRYPPGEAPWVGTEERVSRGRHCLVVSIGDREDRDYIVPET